MTFKKLIVSSVLAASLLGSAQITFAKQGSVSGQSTIKITYKLTNNSSYPIYYGASVDNPLKGNYRHSSNDGGPADGVDSMTILNGSSPAPSKTGAYGSYLPADSNNVTSSASIVMDGQINFENHCSGAFDTCGEHNHGLYFSLTFSTPDGISEMNYLEALNSNDQNSPGINRQIYYASTGTHKTVTICVSSMAEITAWGQTLNGTTNISFNNTKPGFTCPHGSSPLSGHVA